MTQASYNAGNYTTEDPNVAVSNLQYVSPTSITFTASVAAGAPIELDGFALNCPFYRVVVSPGESITPCAVPITPTITSILPSTWTAGQDTSVTITGTGFMPTGNANGCTQTELGIAVATGSVPWSNMIVNSPTSITLTVSPPSTDPAESASVTAANANLNGPPAYLVSNAFTAQICPGATLKSVSPNVWAAGKQTSVTITGTGFIATAAATASCPATTATVTTPDGSAVTVSSVNVASATSITASVNPATSAPTEGATITVSGAPTPNPNADILGAPIISLNGAPITGPNGQPPDPTPVTGQQLALTTTPTAATLAALPVKLTLAKTTPTTWTVTGGTNIGGYTPTSASASVAPMPSLNTPNLTFYSVYPADAVTVTYKYCVSGQTTCPTAAATFDVTGPTGGTMLISPYNHLRIANLGACTLPNGDSVPAGPWLMYGSETSGTCSAPSGGLPGVTFNTPTGYSDASGGVFSVVQLIDSDVESGNENETITDLLDTVYPYGVFPATLNDSPMIQLLPTYGNVSRTMTATTFLMWQPPPPSVPVPLGYQQWTFSGSAACSASCGSAANWTATTNGIPGLVGKFTPSTASQTSVGNNNPPGSNITLEYGIPIWSGSTTQ